MPNIQDQISRLPLATDFPEMTVRAKPVPVYTTYTKEWWLKNHGNSCQFRMWTNPTMDIQWFELALDVPRWLDPATVPESEKMIRVEFKPGESKELPDLRHWNMAIVRILNGVVIGGLAPRLRAAGMNVTVDVGLTHLDGEPLAPEAP